MKKFIILTICSLAFISSYEQIKSPEEFLGYPLGSRYTPHHSIVDYFQYVTNTLPSMVKLQQYGETNEHRPLYISIISSAENMNNLENIRMNNLRLAHIAKDKAMPLENMPAILWLSYNVHGNETSSSEASMLTLYALVNTANTQTKEWLKNTVVIIDPCLNPDGRERYLNWYNTMLGSSYNPEKFAREHSEPWPDGRSNHYNFDLNRDWAWQTQIESRVRLAEYNRWLPQVHVDFHEQGVNSPYYFAPAAEPYHEVLTKWQRDFQVIIGKNNAKYFDKNAWLYYTNQIYDLFYPSYGDTYPMYNGAIGMTYEQGGITAGLGMLTTIGDTLTLKDRIMHHYTTSISTLEVTSENADRLVKEFHKYYNDAVSGSVGSYKSYVVKNNPEDVERISSLITLLDKNDITYGTATGSSKGYNYHTKKEEAFTISNNDLVISTTQPKAALVKVLFEPLSKLSDSVTYDITAWSLPYVYGLDAYATKQSISVANGKVFPDFINNSDEDAYGYVIKWQGLYSAKVVAGLLSKGIRIRFSITPFDMGTQHFNSGSVVITKDGNAKFGNDLWKKVSDACNTNRIKMYPVTTGLVAKGGDFGSDKIQYIKTPKVAMLTGDGVNENAAGEIWDFFDNELQYPLTLVNANDFNNIKWSEVDVLILPDGRYKFLEDKESADELHQWVENGGKVIALQKAASQLSKQKWSAVHVKNDSLYVDSLDKKNPYTALKIFGNKERDDLSANTPGAIYKVDIDNTHPLMFGYPKYYYTLKMDTVVYNFIKKEGWNTGVLKKENQMAGYVGYKLSPKLKDGLLFGVQESKKGSIVYLADDIIFRNFWENGKLMLCNAVFLVGQ